MRTRQEIEKEAKGRTSTTTDKLVVELLLDIRDLNIAILKRVGGVQEDLKRKWKLNQMQ